MTLDEVDLYMRTWIEILNNLMARFPSLVDLYMRSWIEITLHYGNVCFKEVDLYMRSWIEIALGSSDSPIVVGRPLHEVVNWNKDVVMTVSAAGRRPLQWGRELKFLLLPQNLSHSCRPLCEVVNWNVEHLSKPGMYYSQPLHEVAD